MKIEVSENFNSKFLNEKEIRDIIGEIKYEVKLNEEERFPENISFIPKMTILPYARYSHSEDKLEIFVPRLFLSGNYLDNKGLKAMMKHILTHEIVEPIERKTISAGLKALFNRFYFTLTPLIGPSLDLQSSDLSLEAFCEDTCEDINTDRRCLYSNEQEFGFSLIHKEILEVEKSKIENLKIEKVSGKYYSNMQPYELICFILSMMRKAVINKKVRKYRLGRFQSTLLLHTIGKKIKYQELQECLYLMIKELKNQNPSYKKVYDYAMSFVNKLNYNN